MITVYLGSSVYGQERLRWKFTPGDERTIVMTNESESRGAGAGISNKTEMVATMSWRVNKVDEHGSAQVEQKIQRVKMTMNLTGMQPLEYYSSSPDPNPNPILAASLPVLQSLLDSSFQMTITRQGRITAFGGTEGIEAAVEAAGAIGSLPDLKKAAESATVMFPRTPVQPGQSWSNERTIASPLGKMTLNTTYTLIGDEIVDSRVLKKIGVTIEMSLEPTTTGGAKIELKNGQVEGQILFDNSAGYLVKQTLTTILEIKVNDAIEIKTVQKMTMEVKE